jgi:SMI1/KNR4 family protein SUKH-1
MTIDDALALLERDAALHLTQRCSEHELDALEEALGQCLPADFRSLLVRVGGGILYDRHEVFGGRRLIVHDIELVPDLLSMYRLLAESHANWPAHLVPMHRSQGVLHLLDLSAGAGHASVQAADGRAWPNLPAFLDAVVLPARPPVQAPPRETRA